ncbi:MAG: hypothetical protein HGA90_02180 [Alphaproteobacteria bacterium]|nr:hypothetical protein [Alphaproteobacteria bacterium]
MPPPELFDATPSSLFFGDDEIDKIEDEVDKAAPQRPALGGETLRLDAILYTSPESWTVWLQGERWTPATTRPSLRIVSVSPREVEIELTPLLEEEPQRTVLQPNQAVNLLTGQIAGR